LAQAVAEDGGHDAAVLAARQDLGILATGRHHTAIAAEEPVVHARLERQDGVPHVELAGAQPGADLGAHVAADAFADAAEIEGRARLGHLLRLAVDVVDDVVRADEHARAALAAAPEGDHLVHHLLEGDVPHDGRTLAYRCRQRKRRTPAGPPPCRRVTRVRRHCPGPRARRWTATSRTGPSTSSRWATPRASSGRSIVRTPQCWPRWRTAFPPRRSPERRRAATSPPIRSATQRSRPCSS